MNTGVLGTELPQQILVSQFAREDILRMLLETSGQAALTNVQVHTLQGFINARAQDLAPRQLLDAVRIDLEVTKILYEITHDEQVQQRYGISNAQRGIFRQTPTKNAIAQAVRVLLQANPQLWENDEGRPLPKIVAGIAREVRARTQAQYYTAYEAWTHAFAHTEGLVNAGVLANNAQLASLLQQVPPMAVVPLETQLTDARVAADGTDIAETTTSTDVPATTVTKYQSVDQEIEGVIRGIRQCLAQGVPPRELAVGYCDSHYLLALIRSLREAQIPFAAPNVYCWADHQLVRAFSTLIQIDPVAFPRQELTTVVESDTLKGYRLSKWDWWTRSHQRVVGGQDWDKLAASGENGYYQQLMQLRADLEKLHQATSWQDCARQLTQLLETYFTLRSYPEATGVIREAIAVLNTPQSLPPYSLAQAFEILELHFAQPQPAQHTSGITINHLEALVGRRLHSSWIVGAAEHTLPQKIATQACYSLAQIGTDPTAEVARQQEIFDQACQAARHTHLSYAAFSLDHGAHLASPWLPADVPVKSAEHSFMVRQRGGELIPLSASDLRVTQVLQGVKPTRANDHTDSKRPSFQEIHEARLAGAGKGHRLGAYNGYVPVRRTQEKLAEMYFSATAFDQYLRDPQVFFLERLADGRMLEDPQSTSQIDPLERGSAYHRVLERWTKDLWLIPAATPESFDWDHAEQYLEQLIAQELDRMPKAGYTDLAWEFFRDDFTLELRDWFQLERKSCSGPNPWWPIGAEVALNTEGHPLLLQVALPGNDPHTEVPSSMLSIKLVGSIDRVMTNAAGELLLIDYKTGKIDNYKSLKRDFLGNPDGGYRLQLALYALAGHAKPDILGLAAPPTSITTAYHFLHRDGAGFLPMTFDKEALEKAAAYIARAYQHMDAGEFPPTYQGFFNSKPTQHQVRQGAAITEEYAKAAKKAELYPFDLSVDYPLDPQA